MQWGVCDSLVEYIYIHGKSPIHQSINIYLYIYIYHIYHIYIYFWVHMPPIDLRNGGRKTCVSSITLWLPCPALPRPSGFPPRRKLSWASLAPVRPGDVHLGTSKKFWNSTVGFGSQFYIPWQWKPRPKKKKVCFLLPLPLRTRLMIFHQLCHAWLCLALV